MLSVGKILALAAVMSGGLAGCASIPDPGNWIATAQVDPFTDALFKILALIGVLGIE